MKPRGAWRESVSTGVGSALTATFVFAVMYGVFDRTLTLSLIIAGAALGIALWSFRRWRWLRELFGMGVFPGA